MSDKPGTVLDQRYELLEEVGKGGMATVWRGMAHGAEGFRRPVAIKRIKQEFLTSPHIHQLFVEESRVGSLLRHPGVVQVHDFGVDAGGQQYLVTEWVEGLHLGDYGRAFVSAREPMPWDFLATIMVDVLGALHAAHTRLDDTGAVSPILHRDVTPENILLDVSGIVKLTDFGMARAMDRGRMTHPDVVKGKLSYLAPELVLGVDPSVQSDLFAVGIVMWELLTGERLFDAPTDAEVVEKLRAPRIPMLSMRRADLPISFTMLVHRALEREPEKRFSSAFGMLRALMVELRNQPNPVERPRLAESFTAARRRLGSDG